VTTHYMDEAMFCDRIAMMHAGRIIDQDTPARLMQRPLKSPLLELHAPDCQGCAGILQQQPQVMDIIPHAGMLRIRLKPGSNVETEQQAIRQLAQQHNVVIEKLQPAQAELEDIFIATLESEEAGAVE